MFTLVAECSFDAAHFLHGYKGKCSNIHGHRWRVIVEIYSDALSEETHTRGMIVDFDTLKEDIKKEVVIVEDESMNYDVAQYKRLTKDLKNLEKEVNTMKDIIVTKFMEGKRPTSPLCKVSISTYTTKRFDSAKFKEDHPDEYNNYVKENTVTKIDIK